MNKQDVNNPEPIREFKEASVYTIILIVFIVFFIILFLMFIGISILNINNETIASGIYIKNINVSRLEKNEAIELVSKELSKHMKDNIVLKYNESSFNITVPNMIIKVGDKISITGKSGQGKTSIINLIL